MKPLKSWFSFANRLQVRGQQIYNSAAALDNLERLNYYRLNTYWYLLRAIAPAALNAQGKGVCVDALRPRIDQAGRDRYTVEAQGIPSW
ncbi:hypothetical protein WL10_33215 [Burkholderia ubonensis]|uniref:hypothetical protein n=1 Tax=Burkholderia ubonensis TaxID=101571 RepID=UPI00076C4F87|nr:hypothetical protein [Burkholderia ubonensis]KVX97782.1 hypothetical protein WL10_33215 [Burkholderia ubonensis]